MDDGWEIYFLLDPLDSADAYYDEDKDELVNLYEFNNSLFDGYEDDAILQNCESAKFKS